MCDSCERSRSIVHAPRRTVNNNITRSPVYRQRWGTRGLGREECVGFIVNVPRTEKSEIWTGVKTERKIQVEVFEQRLQLLGGGHCRRVSV